MKYNLLGSTELKVSEVGFGGEYLEGKDEKTVRDTIDMAMDAGVNILDVFMSEPDVRTNIGKALKGKREKMYIQGHICAAWKDGQYCRTRKKDECRFFFEDLLTRLQTDYIDFGMMHLIDSQQDYADVFEGEVIEYALSLKKEGKIRHLGFSSHDPATAQRIVDRWPVEVMLFSINPAYDLLPEEVRVPYDYDKDAFRKGDIQGISPERDKLYKTCQAKGIGITSMKTLAAGSLLKAESSPFGMPMTVTQCISYALSRPAVASVLLGLQTVEQVRTALAYESATDAEKDYTPILSSDPAYSMKGRCMYCNHCLPCSADLDIAQINKFYDLATMGGDVPPTLREHYASLSHTASECIECGICESSCPFGVEIVDRMKKTAELFGR